MATRLQINQGERLKIIQDRINQYDIRFPNAELSEKLNVDAGNISNMLNGKKPISDNFFTSFIDAYPEKKKNEEESKPILNSDNVSISLQDFINLQEQRIKELTADKEWFKSIINSALMKISIDQQFVLAYQKAWVDYEAEKMAGDDQAKKKEIMYKMNKLVDDKIQNDASKGTPGGIDK